METERIVSVLNHYLQEIGVKAESGFNYIDESVVSSLFVMKLANANVIPKNKADRSSHQTHIAVTGEAIHFFCDRNTFETMDYNEIKTLKIFLSPVNVSYLLEDKTNNTDGVFDECDVSFGKRTQNQLQLSKSQSANGRLFNQLREGLYVNDLLVFWKERNSDKIFALGMKYDNYTAYDHEFERSFNSTLLIKEEDNEPEPFASNGDNTMTLRIFREKDTDTGTCYLCGCSLTEYINNLSPEYMDNDIQRGIVRNAYLDRLVSTIINNDNIPTITLLGESLEVTCEGKYLELKNPRILDGLQRTFRIQAIWNCIMYFNSLENKEALAQMNKLQLSRFLAEKNEKHDINILLEIIGEYKLNGNLNRLIKGFEKNEQWFEVWEELPLEQETKKMLILNAGHRQMDYRHQLELLFLNCWGKLKELFSNNDNVVLIRNKQKTDMQYSKERKTGEFYFSHIISSFISYSKGLPITTNADLISKLQQEKEFEDEDISYAKIKQIILFLIDFDKSLFKEYQNTGTKWIAKETVLVGVFAALGQYGKEHGNETALDYLLSNVKALNLNSYDLAKQRNIDVSKVNMGNITKNTVRDALLDLFNGKIQIIMWDNYFGEKEK